MGNVPKLRFPEFKGAWEKKMLGEIAERVTIKNKECVENVLTISAQFGLISQLEFFNKSVSAKDVTGYYLLSKNDFAYNKSYSNGFPMGAIKRLTRYEKGVVSTLYICFRNKNEFDNSFAEQYFEKGNQNKEIEKVAQEGARNHGLLNIGVNDFFGIELTIPTLPEQIRIASFFNVLDNKIAQLKQKKALLEQYKKGVMQKLFSQELRFKDEDGKEFADWEEKSVSDLGVIITGSTPPTVNREYYDGEFLFVSPFDITETRFISNTKTTLTKVGFLKGRLVRKGSTLFVCIGSTIGKVGQVHVDCITNQQINAVVPVNNDDDFIYSLMQFHSDKIQKLAATQAVPIINKTTFSNYLLFVPCLAEQTIIANFLSALDEKINRTENQMQQTQQYKKGLLQNMFC